MDVYRDEANELLKSKNKKCVPVVASGDCFYRSMRLALTGHQSGYGGERKRIFEFIMNHWEYFVDSFLTYKDFIQWLIEILTKFEYADDKVLIAACCVYNIDIRIYELKDETTPTNGEGTPTTTKTFAPTFQASDHIGVDVWDSLDNVTIVELAR